MGSDIEETPVVVQLDDACIRACLQRLRKNSKMHAVPWKSGPFRAALEPLLEAFRPGGRSPQGLKPSMFRLDAGLKAASSTKTVPHL